MIGLRNFLNQKQNSRIFFRYFFVFIFILNFFFVLESKSASVPAVINYQGKILQSGTAVDGNLGMSFTIYDELTGGNAVYTAFGILPTVATGSIAINEGLFSINLGSGITNVLDAAVFASHENLFLEIIVGGETLSPRKRLTAVPYAFNAKYLNGISATSTSVTSTYIPVSDENGNFDFNSITSTDLKVSNSISLGSEAINSWNDIFAGVIVSTTQGGTNKDSSAWTGLVRVIAGDWSTTTISYNELVNSPVLSTSSWNWAYNTVLNSSTDWQDAFSWGDHSLAGYLTNYVETDPIWTAASSSYFTKTYLNSVMVSTTDSKNINDILMYTASGIEWVPTSTLGILGGGATAAAGSIGQIQFNADGINFGATSTFVWDNGRLGIGTTTPDYELTVEGSVKITGDFWINNINKSLDWDWAYNLVFASSSDWSTAFSWGDHNLAGYLTDYTETDPVWAASSTNYYTKTEVDGLVSSTKAVYVTTTPYTIAGNFATSGYTGYKAGNFRCQNEFGLEYHMCTTEDIFSIINFNNFIYFSFTNDAWVSNGPPGYTVKANDCRGWTSNSGVATYGAYWDFQTYASGGGEANLTTCNLEKAISCCR